jgi:hypothetical protein
MFLFFSLLNAFIKSNQIMKSILTTAILLLLAVPTFSQIKSSIVDLNSILVNGKIPFKSSKKTIENYYANNYLKEKYEPECGRFDAEEFYSLQFFLYKKNGIQFFVYNSIAEFDQINLTKQDSNFIQIGMFKITNKTTLNDLKRYFPKSFNAYMEDYKNDKNIKESFFRLSPCKDCDDQIHIILDKKLKVKIVAYWSPC